MKAVANKARRTKHDFYNATLAPVNRQRHAQFRFVDVALLAVLFVEMGVLVRYLLAN